MPPKPAAPTTKPDDALSFDQAISQAEDLLARMESGDMDLEDALKAYDRGMALLERCKVVLAHAQQRVEEIAARSGASTTDQSDAPSNP